MVKQQTHGLTTHHRLPSVRDVRAATTLDMMNKTEMANIHMQVLAWRYVLSFLGYTLKVYGNGI